MTEEDRRLRAAMDALEEELRLGRAQSTMLLALAQANGLRAWFWMRACIIQAMLIAGLIYKLA